MYDTNIFKEVKSYLKPQQVAEYYLREKGKRSGNNLFYKSPFRQEKTASFCVSDIKGFHDYGTGWHGDVINFVAELFNFTQGEAAKLLIKDFSLPITMNKKVSYKEVKEHKKKKLVKEKVEKGLNNWFNVTYIHLCDENRTNDKIVEIISARLKYITSSEQEKIYEALKYLYNKQLMLEMWIECFIDVKTDEDKLELFRQRKEVEKLWI